MNHASLFRMSLVASPKQSLSKISGYRPHKVSQIESLPQTWVIKPSMLARSVYTRKGRDGQWKTVRLFLQTAYKTVHTESNTVDTDFSDVYMNHAFLFKMCL